ncbi:MAG: hypothetical protein H7124_11985 [Phycisphaerales bacterium]|nr:hypothetical protein [Hyphomonadaceae bacterium]
MTNLLYLAVSTAAFMTAVLVGWGKSPWPIKAIILALSFTVIVAARYFLANKLSFQYLLFARASIWLTAFLLITSAMMVGLGAELTAAEMAAALFAGFLGVFATSLMILLAMGKPCPACDGRSPIQFIKGPTLWGGTDGFQLRFWQSGVASRCPICDADWSFTEAELREARERKTLS